MNFKNLSDDQLTVQTKDLVKKENVLIRQVIEHLQEIYDRRLYLKRGYSSLFEYCTQELGYSETSAGRRTSCVRLVNDIPEAKESLESGALTLSVCAQV